MTGACIEESNCNWELATVCAFNQSTTANKVSFLACMDDASSDVALTAAKSCAEASKVDDSALVTCYHGAEGQALLKEASAIWNKKFPSRATVPHTFVQGSNVQAAFGDLKSSLCKAGSSAAVCKGLQQGAELCYA